MRVAIYIVEHDIFQAMVPPDALLAILHGNFIPPAFTEHSLAIRHVYSRLHPNERNHIDGLIDEEDTVGIVCLFSPSFSKFVVCENETEWVHHATEAEVLVEGGSRA